MTRWQAFTLFFCIVQAAFGQNPACLGIEITEAVRNADARIRIGYALSQQWSAEASSSFHLCAPKKEAADKAPSMELSVRHWTRECYKGSYLCLGLVCGFRRITDVKLGLGYSMPICRCIGIDLGYGIEAIDTIRQKAPVSGKITLDIHYIF